MEDEQNHIETETMATHRKILYAKNIRCEKYGFFSLEMLLLTHSSVVDNNKKRRKVTVNWKLNAEPVLNRIISNCECHQDNHQLILKQKRRRLRKWGKNNEEDNKKAQVTKISQMRNCANESENIFQKNENE